MTMTDANDFLMGGGTASAKFPTPGTTVTGTICRQPEIQQQTDVTTGEPKFWEDGKPRQQLQVQLQTGDRDPAIDYDDGVRAVYIKGNMQKAVKEAVKRSGAKGLEIGGTLTVTYTGDAESAKRGMNPPKMYSASYIPAAAATANEFINQGEPAPAAPAPQPVQQYAPPAPAPVQQTAPAMPAGADPQAWTAYCQLTDAQKTMFFPQGFAAGVKV